jgi:SAM-dependent methyltransferase
MYCPIMLPPIGPLPLNGLCRFEHFVGLADWIHETVPFGRASFGPSFPAGSEYRKHWEVAQAGRALNGAGCLVPTSEILGVGAGNEPTIFWLTNHVRRVFATDLYLADGWEESANASMLIEPQTDWYGQWQVNRLVVQHMDCRQLRYDDCSFDGAFSSSSIEHFGTHADVADAVREVHRVLKPGGVFSVSTEYRLAGPGPGLPGILMFDEAELRATVIEAADWEPLEDLDLVDPRPQSGVASFERAAANVRQHTARHGELVWSELHWPEYPHIVLSQDDLVWTSVHLALRKRG